MSTQRHCCRVAKFLSWAVIATPTGSSRARNSTIQRAAPGQRPVASPPHALNSRRHCCANGKVLVVGGAGLTGDPLTSAELYDPVSGIWTLTGSLSDARNDHTATLLPNGNVLVAGGDGGFAGFASAELYDPASGTWTVTGSLNTTRSNFTATLLPNGKVLVTGGEGSDLESLASAELYDPESGTWTLTDSLASGRQSHTGTLLPSGNVLVVGGFDSNFLSIASAELYDSADGSWIDMGSLGTAARVFTRRRCCPTARCSSREDTVPAPYLASAELYDPSQRDLDTDRQPHHRTLLFTQRRCSPTARCSLQRGFSTSGVYRERGTLRSGERDLVGHWQPRQRTLLAHGDIAAQWQGARRRGNVRRAECHYRSAELYDPASGTWTATGSLASAARFQSHGDVAAQRQGARGSGRGLPQDASASAETIRSGKRDLDGNGQSRQWTRWAHTATLLPNGKVLVAAGFDSTASRFATAELYDPASGTWTLPPATSPPDGSGHTATLLPNGKVLVAGGL